MNIRHTLVVAVPMLAAAAMAVAFPAVAQASTGGGCLSGQAPGNSIEACISASGLYEIPDMYLNFLPGGTCESVNFYVTDETSGQIIWSTGIPCQTGHFPQASPWHLTGFPGHTYKSHVQYDGTNLTVTVDSPPQYFTW